MNRALDEKACPAGLHKQHTIGSELCFRDVIYLNYGPQPFKCVFVGCKFHRIGFEDNGLRQAHFNDHDRPWKCDVPSCEYSEIGFISRPMREEHLDKFHQRDQPDQTILTSNELSHDQTMSLIIALIRADKVQAVQLLIPKLSLNVRHSDFNSFLTEIASSGSPQMVRVALDTLAVECDGFRGSGIYKYLLLPAVRTGNYAAMEWVVSDTSDWKSHYSMHMVDVLAEALHSGWFRRILDTLEPVNIVYFTDWWYSRSACFQPKVIAATRNCSEREDKLISMWNKLEKMDKAKGVLSTGLSSVAKTTCSLKLASALIELGANVNVGEFKKNCPTPLHRAAMQDTMENARFMQFLLLHGANPDVDYRKADGYEMQTVNGSNRRVFRFKVVQVSEEEGPKGLSKWLGRSWEELVEETREARSGK